MSQHILHILGPSRRDEVAGIVGDRAALLALRTAIDSAILNGAGGTMAYQSDGEYFLVAVALHNNMQDVCTGYAGEAASQRSKREQTAIRAVPNFWPALSKAMMSRDMDTAGSKAVGLSPSQRALETDGDQSMAGSSSTRSQGTVRIRRM